MHRTWKLIKRNEVWWAGHSRWLEANAKTCWPEVGCNEGACRIMFIGGKCYLRCAEKMTLICCDDKSKSKSG